jgi:glycosyltransferase involved in cell wall biosynthesis
MKIAILTPHPNPLALGGLENLKWGLQAAIERLTPHTCDVIGQISPEGDFWEVVESYRQASLLDLSSYDCVISGKYPMWMVDHPNHVLFMLHKLRGLYDTYPGGPGAAELRRVPELAALMQWMRETAANGRFDGRAENTVLFDKLDQLRTREIPDLVYSFPGPLIREIVHFLDAGSISTRQMSRFAAQSRTVLGRADYLPANADTSILYPPAHRADYFCGGSEYFFTSSRLDAPKRIDMLIAAMRRVRADIPLLIAGTGPDEARLRALADGDDRIRFLGFVPDEAMPELYAHARAIPFVPYDEDYGLVTVEAMQSSKPVLSFTDSGGPTEFIRNSHNGFVVPPSADALAERLEYLASHQAEAVEMGRRAKLDVADITWENLVQGLLAERPVRAVSRSRPKLTVATTFPIYPPVGGGQARVFNLYRGLAEKFDVEVVTLASGGPALGETHIGPGLKETRVAKSDAHEELEREYSRAVDGVPVTDIAASALLDLTPAFAKAVELSAMESVAVIASHPYLVDTLRAAAPEKPLWYDAHNVELSLKQSVFESVSEREKVLAEVRRVEARCWREASLVFACAARDLGELDRIYGATRAELLEVPNGVELADFSYTAFPERRRLKQVTATGHQLALFIGSWHAPNIEAVELILAEASDAPKTIFLVAGSCGSPFMDKTIPANVQLLGPIDNQRRADLLAVADVALNPMRSGSGTNLKMLDYFASGVPVISTAFGARGLLAAAGRHFIAAEPGQIASMLRQLQDSPQEKLEEQVEAARRLVEDHYSWQSIASRFAQELTDHKLV